jgi:hypothetical protein
MCQTACKPGSVPPLELSPWAGMAIPLGRPLPSASCDRPERRREGPPGMPANGDACRSYLVLLPVGFSLPPPLPAARCALTAPFHPCRPPNISGRPAVYFLWHFPWSRPRRALPGTVPPWSPDFPPSAQRRGAAIRPSGAGRFGYSPGRCQRPQAKSRRPPETSLQNPAATVTPFHGSAATQPQHPDEYDRNQPRIHQGSVAARPELRHAPQKTGRDQRSDPRAMNNRVCRPSSGRGQWRPEARTTPRKFDRIRDRGTRL